jgi:hypothetical protein
MLATLYACKRDGRRVFVGQVTLDHDVGAVVYDGRVFARTAEHDDADGVTYLEVSAAFVEKQERRDGADPQR